MCCPKPPRACVVRITGSTSESASTHVKAYPQINFVTESWLKAISMDCGEAGLLFCFVLFPYLSSLPVESISDLRTCNTYAFITKYCLVQACTHAYHIVLSKAFDYHGDQIEINCSSW